MKRDLVLTIPVPVPHEVFNALCDYMDEVHCKRHITFVAGDAIKAWIADARKRAAESPTAVAQGYQWKILFLPSGTRLKTSVRGRTMYAVVEGERIIHENRTMSPHEFANAFGVRGRNAWRDIWIHLPYDETWRLAATVRKSLAEGTGRIQSWS